MTVLFGSGGASCPEHQRIYPAPPSTNTANRVTIHGKLVYCHNMLPDYSDITDAAGEPLWWDAHGAPRYRPFHPNTLGVYDHLALHVLIECQSCARPFPVGEGWHRVGMVIDPATRRVSWVERTLADVATGYHYGDPPFHDCGGSSENCVDRRILSAWTRIVGGVWTRDPDVEQIDIFPAWADEIRHRRGQP